MSVKKSNSWLGWTEVFLLILVAAHPGFSATGLRTDLSDPKTPTFHRMLGYFFESISQSVEIGVFPQVYAATGLCVQGGEYISPAGLLQKGGFHKKVRSSAKSYNEDLARRLWEVSESLTGVTYQALQ